MPLTIQTSSPIFPLLFVKMAYVENKLISRAQERASLAFLQIYVPSKAICTLSTELIREHHVLCSACCLPAPP